MIEAPIPCSINISGSARHRMFRAKLSERLRVWWSNNVTNLTWLNRLALFWLNRQLTRDAGWYITWHANIAMRLYDLQDRHSVCGNDADGNIAKLTVFFDTGNFDFSIPTHRDFVAHEIMKLVFNVDDALYQRAYGQPVANSNPRYAAALSTYIDSLCGLSLPELEKKYTETTPGVAVDPYQQTR